MKLNIFKRGYGLKNYYNSRDKKSDKTKAFTNKRKRDRLQELAFNIKQKGEKIMRDKIKNTHNNLTGKSQIYFNLCVFCRILWRVARMVAPALIGAYLVWFYDDTIIIAIGVASMLYSLLAVVNSAYLAETSFNKKRK